MLNPTSSGVARYANGEVHNVLTVVDAPFRSRLGLALGEIAEPIHLDSLTEAASVASERPVRAVLFGTGSLGPSSYAVVRKLVTTGSCLPIVVLDRWTPEASDALLALGRYGVREVVDTSSREGLRKLRGLLTRPEANVAQRVLDALRPELAGATEDMRMFLCDLVQAAPTVRSATALSERVGLNASALNSRFFRASLPSPKTYLAAVRLLYAAAILEDARVSLAQVAIRLHYSSPQSFTRHIREQVGIPANEFRVKYSFTALASHTTHHLLTKHRGTLRWFAPLDRGTGADDDGTNAPE